MLALGCWSALFYLIPADTIVESVGISNSYIVSFGISLVAGFSVFTGTAAYAAVIEFSRGGANALYLGLASGIGLFLSDSIFYVLVMRGRESIESKFGPRLEKLNRLLIRVPDPVVYLGIFIFCAFGPIPNDIILAALMVTGYEYRKFWPVLLAADVTFMLFLSFLFQQ
ncbi:MAG: hypothetical protein JWL75_667 [Parcubacteria group bacterium]|nr:hypothetical protein [Parcubacteria group bacterium]